MARKIYKHKIVAIRQTEPDVTYQEIADRLGCSIATVWNTCYLTDTKRGHVASRDIMKLGWAAKRAGLTVQQIEGMANARNA